MRALGAYHNVFSIESFMTELAELAGIDPVEFRLNHLEDKRGREVVEKAAKEFGWQKGQKAPAGSRLWLCLCALQEPGGLLRHCQRGGSEPGDRPSAPGARGSCGR